MSSNLYVESLWKELEAAWDLCVLANDYPESVRSDPQKIWDDFFCKSMDVEINKPLSISNGSRLEVFCKNKYGIYFNEKIKSWVPFRHESIDLEKF